MLHAWFQQHHQDLPLVLSGVLIGSSLLLLTGCGAAQKKQEEVPMSMTATEMTMTETTISAATATTTTTESTTTTAAAPPATEPPATEAPTEPPVPEETPAPVAEATYINGILVVNKTYALPPDYNPGMDPTCSAQFEVMRQAAAAERMNIYLASGFRSYEYQGKVYNSFLAAYGQEKTDTLSARPGHSEHQTGLAIDVNSVTDSFANTAEAAWLAAHAHEYGFIIRYPKGKEHITGYKYEPWHIRYLGVDIATAVYNSGLCLEEYLGITSCYTE